MRQKPLIFISYSRKNIEQITPYLSALEQNYSLWIDRTGIENSEQFKEKIVSAIKKCDYFVFFSSKASNESEWTAKEIGMAVSLKKPIIPIRIDASSYNDSVAFDLVNINYSDDSAEHHIFSLLSSLSAIQRSRRKNKRIWIACASAFLLLLISLIFVLAFRQHSPVRGRILDEYGAVLAYTIVNDTTRLIINCTIGPDSKWEREAKDFAGDLARFCPERNAYQYYSELEEGRKKNKQYLVLVKEVSSDTYKQIKSLPFFSGTRTRRLVSDDRDLYLRKYPRGGLARRTIGDLNSRDTTREFSIGLEGSFYKDLMKYDLRTTLNIDFQEISEQIVQKAFKGSTDMGSVCLSIMDIHTGAIKTIVNLERMKNDDSPRENYNMYLSSAYEPGALFLPVSYAVLMENAKININDSLLTSSVYSALEIPYRDPFLQNLSHVGDKICIKDGLVFSSNVICRYLVSQYFSSDCSAFYSSLDKLKLLSPLSFDIPAKCETKYIAPGDDGWEYNHLLLHCCGLGIEMPPILLHSFYNTIANGGIYVKPYIAESLEKDGEIKKDLRCRNSKKILSERTTECISNALMDVVSNGTPSHQFRNSRTLVAGKTGTTLMRTKQQYIHSSFIGYFPADKPVFSILVVCSPLKDSSSSRSLYGGTVPAMIANQVVDTLFNMNPNLIYR